MRKLKLWIVASASVLLLNLSSCASSSTTSSVAEPVYTEKVTLSFMASQDWVQDAELDLARQFDEKTGIGVNYQIFPSSQYNNLLMTKLNTGECPDIFAAQSEKFDIKSQYCVEKNAIDLSNTKWASRTEPLAAAELSVDGRLYGQPTQDVSAVWALGYNKKIFEELNLAVPQSYSEFLQVCSAIQASGITPIYECLSDGWHHTLWFIESCIVQEKIEPGYQDKLNANTANFSDNKIFLQILQQIQEMVDLGYWGEGYISNTYSGAPTAIASGEYAMVVYNQGLGEEVHTINSDIAVDDIGYFVLPLANNQTLNVNPAGPARFIYSGTQHLDEALDYLDFLASQESLAYLTEHVPKYNKLPFDNAPQTYTNSIEEFYSQYTESLVVYQTSVKYVNPQWTEIGVDLTKMLTGEICAEQILENIDRRRAEQANIANDPGW